jgi:hypothetical protein
MENELKEIRKIIVSHSIGGIEYQEGNEPEFIKDKSTIELLKEIISIKLEIESHLKFCNSQTMITEEGLQILMNKN